MARSTGGCAFLVWYLLRHAMGWYGTVSLGCTIGGGGDGKLCWMCTLEAGSHGAGSLGTLVIGWGGMGCCSLGWFSILFWTLINLRVWSGAGNGMVAVGAVVSYKDSQLEEASFRAVMAYSWLSDWSVGAFLRAFISVVSPCRIRSSRVTTGVVMVWWQNSIVSEIWFTLV